MLGETIDLNQKTVDHDLGLIEFALRGFRSKPLEAFPAGVPIVHLTHLPISPFPSGSVLPVSLSPHRLIPLFSSFPPVFLSSQLLIFLSSHLLLFRGWRFLTLGLVPFNLEPLKNCLLLADREIGIFRVPFPISSFDKGDRGPGVSDL